MDTTRSPGAGIKRLVNAAENKLTAPYVLQVIVAFWSETDLIIVGLLGRTCLIFLITEKNGLQTRTRRLPLVTASGEVMAVMLPREEDREKAENAYEFWSPDKIMPAVNEIMRGRAQELRQDSFWTNFPRGQFAPAYSGGDVEISLIAVLYYQCGAGAPSPAHHHPAPPEPPVTTTTPAATTTTPAAVVAIRKIPSGSGFGVPHAPAIYAPVQTRDGRWVWRLRERCLLGTLWGKDGRRRERGVYSVAKAERLAAEIAAERGIQEHPAAHNRALSPKEIKRFVNPA